jgi:galactokinase
MARAPGRVNLIGEHIDYNDGPVLPFAIEREVIIAAAPNDDTRAQIWSEGLDEAVQIPVGGLVPVGPAGWSNYLRGVLSGFRRRGVVIPGFDAVVVSNLSHGCGLSSSAALEVALATLIEALTGIVLSPMEKALLCQRAEHDFAGVPCGIMDQFASVFGAKDHAVLIDCRTRETRAIPLPDPGVVFLIIDSKVKHSLADGAYANRRQTCEAGAKTLGVYSLRDWLPAQLPEAEKQLDALTFRRVRHVVTEIERTFEAVKRLEAADWPSFGNLMYESHASLRDDYEVSCPELDEIVRIAQGMGAANGILGCRMTGGGFGGSAIALVKNEAVEPVRFAITEGYTRSFGISPGIFITRAADGASVLGLTG